MKNRAGIYRVLSKKRWCYLEIAGVIRVTEIRVKSAAVLVIMVSWSYFFFIKFLINSV